MIVPVSRHYSFSEAFGEIIRPRKIYSVSCKKPRIYVSVAFQVPRAMADDAAGILITDGALGCEVSKISRRARTANSVNNTVLLRAYFERMTPVMLERLQGRLQAARMLANGSTPELRELEDPGWATMWQTRFTPLRIGQRFLIVPPWRHEREPDRIQLVIRPGQAFGTGHHPSTSGTLSALEELCKNRHVAHALDVGTGSGILAIAMVKLGVAEVTAIDTDVAAVASAKENARLNRVTARTRFSTTPLGSLRGRFGLIAANILSSTLIQMAPDLIARLRHQGHLVLAGILQREAKSVAAAYLPELTYIGARNHGAWTTLIFQK
jgi:ribosomal protein L11 methyltransferase